MTRVKARRKNGLILKIILIISILYTVGMVVSLQVRTESARSEVDSLRQQLDLQKRRNQEAEALLSSDSDDEYVLGMARDKLGYILPGERIFVDSQSTK